jgi:hypothetical protein
MGEWGILLQPEQDAPESALEGKELLCQELSRWPWVAFYCLPARLSLR